MRIYTIRRGEFKGEHIIYDNPGEANSHGIDKITVPWHSPETRAGDWVVSDDGYVVRCLQRYPLKNKRHKSGQYTDCLMFPQGTFTIYHGKNGYKKIKNFYAQFSSNKRSSLGNETSSLGRYMGIRKREFVTLMGLGYDAYTSYIKAFNIKNSNIGYITIQVNKLLMDERVQEELMEALRPFMEKVEQEIVKQSNGEFEDIESLAVNRTAKLLLSQSKSIKDQALVLRFTFEIFGKIKGFIDMIEKKNPKEIQEAQYIVMAPPPLTEAV
jgi:hypothetical protein